MGKLYLRNSSFEDAIRVFHHILTLESKNLSALISLGICNIRLKQFDDASYYLEQALECNTNSVAIFLAFSSLYEAKGNIEKQIHFLMLAANSDPKRFQIRLKLAELLKQHGDLSGASQQYRILLKEHPDLESAHFGLAGILMKENSLDEAIIHFRAVLLRNPSAWDANMNLAFCLYFQKKYATAIPSFVAGLKGCKNHPKAMHALAQCYFHINDWDRSLVLMEKLSELHGDSFNIKYALGELYVKTGEIDSARDTFANLASRFPERPEVFIQWAQTAARMNRFQEAKKALELLFKKHPGHIDGHYTLGNIHAKSGRIQDAFEEFHKTLLINETYRPGLLGVAAMARLLGKQEDEYRALQRALACDSIDSTSLLRIAQLEREMHLPTSLENFRKVIELAPNSLNAREAKYFLRHSEAPLSKVG